MGLWPHVIFSLWSILFLIRAHDGAGRRWVNLLVGVLMMALGLLWHERAVLIVPTLVGVAIVLQDDRRGWRRITGALRTWWPLWVGCLGVLTAFLVAHSAITSVEGGGTEVPEALRISWSFVGENVVPGPALRTVGRGAARRRRPAVGVGHGGRLRRVRRTGRPAGPLGRALGPMGGRWPRRLRAGRPCPGARRPRRLRPDHWPRPPLLRRRGARRGPRGRAGPTRLAAQVRTPRSTTSSGAGSAPVAWCWSARRTSSAPQSRRRRLVPHFQNTEDRVFVTNLRAALAADPNQVLIDALAPADVVLPLGRRRLAAVPDPRTAAGVAGLRPALVAAPPRGRGRQTAPCGTRRSDPDASGTCRRVRLPGPGAGHRRRAGRRDRDTRGGPYRATSPTPRRRSR